MCGIAGRVNFRSRRPMEPSLVQSMCDLLAKYAQVNGTGIENTSVLTRGAWMYAMTVTNTASTAAETSVETQGCTGRGL